MENYKRIHINISNRYNTDASFACMHSPSRNTLYMEFDVFRGIIDRCDQAFELRLEGGEPLLHPLFYLFAEYAVCTGHCRKLILLTNGIVLKNHLRYLKDFSASNHIPLEILMVIKGESTEKYPAHIKMIKNMIAESEFIPNFELRCHFLLRHEDRRTKEVIENSETLRSNSDIVYLCSGEYLLDSLFADKASILYATDGQCFDCDPEARNAYEKSLAVG